MHQLYAISGISGCGKSTLGRRLAESIDNVCCVEQDDYFLQAKPKIVLSNGQSAYNWDSLEALDSEFPNIIKNKLLTQPVLVYGFALCRSMLPIKPSVHVHLIMAKTEQELEERCCAARLQAKDIKDINRDRLRVQECVIPFYHVMLETSDITHNLNVFDDNGDRISLDILTDTILSIINSSK